MAACFPNWKASRPVTGPRNPASSTTTTISARDRHALRETRPDLAKPGASPLAPVDHQKGLKRAFFDISIDGIGKGRILMELFDDTVPKKHCVEINFKRPSIWGLRGRREVLAPRGRLCQRDVVSEFGPKPGPRCRETMSTQVNNFWPSAMATSRCIMGVPSIGSSRTL